MKRIFRRVIVGRGIQCNMRRGHRIPCLTCDVVSQISSGQFNGCVAFEIRFDCGQIFCKIIVFDIWHVGIVEIAVLKVVVEVFCAIEHSQIGPLSRRRCFGLRTHLASLDRGVEIGALHADHAGLRLRYGVFIGVIGSVGGFGLRFRDRFLWFC